MGKEKNGFSEDIENHCSFYNEEYAKLYKQISSIDQSSFEGRDKVYKINDAMRKLHVQELYEYLKKEPKKNFTKHKDAIKLSTKGNKIIQKINEYRNKHIHENAVNKNTIHAVFENKRKLSVKALEEFGHLFTKKNKNDFTVSDLMKKQGVVNYSIGELWGYRRRNKNFKNNHAIDKNHDSKVIKYAYDPVGDLLIFAFKSTRGKYYAYMTAKYTAHVSFKDRNVLGMDSAEKYLESYKAIRSPEELYNHRSYYLERISLSEFINKVQRFDLMKKKLDKKRKGKIMRFYEDTEEMKDLIKATITEAV